MPRSTVAGDLAKAKHEAKAAVKDIKKENAHIKASTNPLGAASRAQRGAPRALASYTLDDREAAKEYTYAVLEPWDAYERGLRPTLADGNSVSAYRFATKHVLNQGTTLNAYTNTYDIAFIATPNGQQHINYSTAFSGASGIITAVTSLNAPSYPSWATSFAEARCVALGMVVRNTTAVLNQNGETIQGRAEWAQMFTTSSPTFSQAGDTIVHGINKPGDMSLVAWRPRWDVNPSVAGRARDIDFAATNVVIDDRNTAAFFWATTGVAGSTFEVTTYAFWEARVLPAIQPLMPMSLKVANHSEAQRLLLKQLTFLPEYSQARTVASDDGSIESVVRDLNGIYNGGKQVWESGTSLWNTASSFFGSIFGRHEWVARVIGHINDDELELLLSLAGGHTTVEQLQERLRTAGSASGDDVMASAFVPKVKTTHYDGMPRWRMPLGASYPERRPPIAPSEGDDYETLCTPSGSAPTGRPVTSAVNAPQQVTRHK